MFWVGGESVGGQRVGDEAENIDWKYIIRTLENPRIQIVRV